VKRLVLIAALASCADPLGPGPGPGPLAPGSSKEAVYGGVPDTSDNGVVGIYIAPPGTTFGTTCTGIVVSPRVVLTAAHCVQPAMAMGFPQTSGFTAYVFFGADENNPASTDNIIDARLHRDYSPTSGTDDLAVVRLQSDAPALPLVLNDQDLTGMIDNKSMVRSVGYGDTNPTMRTGGGTKHQATVPVQMISAQELFVGSSTIGLCFSDSGGPSFYTIGGVEKVIGINTISPSASSVNDCYKQAIVARVDAYLQSFIIPAIDAWDGPCPLDGTCTTTGCRSPDPDCDPCGPDGTCAAMCPQPDWDCPLGNAFGVACSTIYDCESRICVNAPDDARVSYCSQACDPANNTCGNGIDCVMQNGANVCVYQAPSPTAQGHVCADNTQCRSNLCDVGLKICVEQCDPSASDPCPAGYVCTPSTEAPNVCLPPRAKGGVCDVAIGGRPSGVALVIISMLTLLAFARRRAR
jgi:V8-like Glu-specific endopeptidase